MSITKGRVRVGRLPTLGLVCLFLLLTGCGPRATVSGKVLYEGTPLKGGAVGFQTEDNKGFSAAIGEDGTYKIEKIPPGPVKITVMAGSPKIKGVGPGAGPPKDKVKFGPPAGVTLPEGAGPINFDPRGKDTGPKIPEHYADVQKSGLEYTVVAGDQEHNIELKALKQASKQK